MMRQEDRDHIVNLFPSIRQIGDDGIREKVIRAWYNAWKQGNFPRIEDVHQFEPARDRIAYTNVDHTNQVCRVCEQMGEILAAMLNLRLNRDYLLAGAVLHDVDKIVIFDARSGGLTERGLRLPHAVMGAAMAREEGLPEEVAHMIGAHSFKYSPAPPSTIEALLVRHVDHVVAQSFYLSKGLDMEKVLAEAAGRNP
jgi:putative nucleotidyltransferase with HDIG domain